MAFVKIDFENNKLFPLVVEAANENALSVVGVRGFNHEDRCAISIVDLRDLGDPDDNGVNVVLERPFDSDVAGPDPYILTLTGDDWAIIAYCRSLVAAADGRPPIKAEAQL